MSKPLAPEFVASNRQVELFQVSRNDNKGSLSLNHYYHAGVFIQEGIRAGVVSITVWLLLNGEPCGLWLTWGMGFM